MKHWENNISKFSSIDQAQQDIDLKNKAYKDQLSSNKQWCDANITSGEAKRGVDSKIG